MRNHEGAIRVSPRIIIFLDREAAARQVRFRLHALWALDSEFHDAARCKKGSRLRQGYDAARNSPAFIRFRRGKKGQGSGDDSPHLARFKFFILPPQSKS